MNVQAVMLAQKIAAGAFSPTDIAGLQLWLKADSLGLVDTEPIDTWFDSSGNSRNATNSGGSSRALYRTGIVNGMPVVRFNGSSQFFGTASASYAVQSYFLVFSINSSGAGNSYQGLATTRASPNANKVGASDTNNGFSTGVAADNTLVNINSSSGGGNGATTYVAIDGVSKSASSFDDFNSGGGIGITSNAFHYVTDIDTSASASGTKIFCIGADAFDPSNRFFWGDIAEVIIYDTNISGTNRTNVETYLKNKYGL